MNKQEGKDQEAKYDTLLKDLEKVTSLKTTAYEGLNNGNILEMYYSFKQMEFDLEETLKEHGASFKVTENGDVMPVLREKAELIDFLKPFDEEIKRCEAGIEEIRKKLNIRL